MSPLNSMFQSSVLNFNYRQDRPYQDWNDELMSLVLITAAKNLSLFGHWTIPTDKINWIFYSLFWVIPRRLNFMCRRFGTFCHFHLRMWCQQEEIFLITPPMKMELTVLKRRHKIRTPRNDLKKKNIHSEHGESLKSRKINFFFVLLRIEWAGKRA